MPIKATTAWRSVFLATLLALPTIWFYWPGQTVVAAWQGEKARAELRTTGNFVRGYTASIHLVGEESDSEIKLYRFFDAPGDWFDYIDEVCWVNERKLTVRLSASAAAYGRNPIIGERSSRDIEVDGFTLAIIIPTDQEVAEYESYIKAIHEGKIKTVKKKDFNEFLAGCMATSK